MPRKPIAIAILTVIIVSIHIAYAADQSIPSAPNALVQLLIQKGVLTAEEGNSVQALPTAAQQDRLLNLLRDKGVISAEDVASVNASPASAQVARDLVASTT